MIDLFQEIYGTIKHNKLRTFLTGFAVAWGIFILIVLLGAGNGLIHAFQENAGRNSLNSISIYGGRTSLPFNGLKEGRRINLNLSDLNTTKKQFEKNIINTGATLSESSVTINFGEEYVSSDLNGVFPNYSEIRAIDIYKGRFINNIDIKEQRKVIVIHKKTAEELFQKTHTNPIGQYLNANGVVYQVIGEYNDNGNSGQLDTYIPFTTLNTIYLKGDSVDQISFTTKGLTTIENNDAFEKDYRKALSNNHKFDPSDRRAIWIWNRMSDYLKQLTAESVLHIAIWVIGIFTLLSGIVGVSNIMLITVKERTHEFGIRKSIGAKPSSILKLIIIESIVITTFFGYIGMVIGIGTTEWMNMIWGSQTMDAGIFTAKVFSNPTIDMSIAIEATVTLIIAGTLAGFFPARKAAKIRPIEALRAD